MPTTIEKVVTDLAQDPTADLVCVGGKYTADGKPAYYRRCCNTWAGDLGNFCTGPMGHKGAHTFDWKEPWPKKPISELVWSTKALREDGTVGVFFRRACNATFGPYFCTLAKGHDGPHQGEGVA